MTPDKYILFSGGSISKVVASGSGSLTAPASTSGNSPQSNTTTIPNTFGTTDIIVAATANSSVSRRVSVPWIANDGRVSFDVGWDASNIYFRATTSTSGSDQAAVAFTYTYNIIML